MPDRAIFRVEMDTFFTSITMLDAPSLAVKAVATDGPGPHAQPRDHRQRLDGPI